MKYDIAVYIGRFQPFHNGHAQVVSKAVELADNVLVLIGSPNVPRSPTNPLTVDERVAMLNQELAHHITDSVKISLGSVDNHPSNSVWVNTIQTMVMQHAKTLSLNNPRVAIVGHDKDESSFYLSLFPNFHVVNVDGFEIDGSVVHATAIRKEFYHGNGKSVETLLPRAVAAKFAKILAEHPGVAEEYHACEKFKKDKVNYPIISVAADAIVTCDGHILLITRKKFGKDLLALPGGFVELHETAQQAAIRELREETGLKLLGTDINSYLRSVTIVDKPTRSERGRIISIAHHFHIPLTPVGALWKVKGSDDALTASWVPISEILQTKAGVNFFEDHQAIIHSVLGVSN